MILYAYDILYFNTHTLFHTNRKYDRININYILQQYVHISVCDNFKQIETTSNIFTPYQTVHYHAGKKCT